MCPLSSWLVLYHAFEHFLFNFLSGHPLSVKCPIIHVAVRIMESWLILKIQLQQCLSIIYRNVHCCRFQHLHVSPKRGNCTAIRVGDAHLIFGGRRMLKNEVSREKVWTTVRMMQLILLLIFTNYRIMVVVKIVLLMYFIEYFFPRWVADWAPRGLQAAIMLFLEDGNLSSAWMIEQIGVRLRT